VDLDPRLRIWPTGPEARAELARQDLALLRLVAGGGLLLALLWMV
jgi:hypothetical protein